jgi:cell division protease FtsH
MSDETNAKIDTAINRLVEQAFLRARDILKTCSALHVSSAERLLDQETFTETDLAPLYSAVRERTSGMLREHAHN